jgi:glycosyltransferase involved in cell wall biosynthesis
MYTPTADGGHAMYSRELLTALVRGGGDRFELVTSRDVAPPFRAVPYPVHAILPALAHRSSFRLTAAWALSRALHYPRRELALLHWLRGRPDVGIVHLQEHRPWLAVPLLRRIRATGRRVFYTVHNVTPNTYPPLLPRALVRRWNREASLLCDGLFVHTRPLADALAAQLGPRRPPIHVVPHGVWTVSPDADRTTADGFAGRLERRRLLFFGVIRRNKGLHVLLDAMDRLSEFHLTVAGEAREPAYVRREILPRIRRLRGAGRSVDLTERFIPDADLPALFADHSALVLPYTRAFAAQSGAAFLALAYNTPVLASDAGGLGELFEGRAVGACFSDPSPAGVADAVRRFFGAAGRGRVLDDSRAAKTHWSWARTAAGTLAAYGEPMHSIRSQ